MCVHRKCWGWAPKPHVRGDVHRIITSIIIVTITSVFFFNWNIIASQCCISLCCPLKWISLYTYSPSLLDLPPSHPPPPHPSGSSESSLSTYHWCWYFGQYLISNTLATWCKELTHLKDHDAGKDWRWEEKGRQRMRWLDGITDSMDMSLG